MNILQILDKRSDTRYSGLTGGSPHITSFDQSLLEPFQYKGWWKKGIVWAVFLFFPWAMGYGVILLPGQWLWNTRRVMRNYWGLPDLASGQSLSYGIMAIVSWCFVYMLPGALVITTIGRFFPSLNPTVIIIAMWLLPSLLWLVAAIRCTLEESLMPFIQVRHNAYLLLAHPLALLRLIAELGFLSLIVGIYYAALLFTFRASRHFVTVSPETWLTILGFIILMAFSPFAAIIIAHTPSYIMARFARSIGLSIIFKKEDQTGKVYFTMGLTKRKMKNGLVSRSYIIHFGEHRNHISTSGVLRKATKVKIRRIAEERL
jgi:hypothetical protein